MTDASGIDSYLKGRGSPMAGFGTTFLRAGKKYGVDPRLLVGIATIESGAGEHEKLQYNPFNWGVHRGQTYGSYNEAIMDVARGLKRGYIDQGLTTPQQIVSKYAPASDNNDEGNWASVVSQVMGQLGGKSTMQAGAPRRGRGAAPVRPVPLIPPRASSVPQFSRELFAQNLQRQLMSGQGIGGRGLTEMIFASYQAPPLTPPAAPGVPSPGIPPTPGAAPPSGKGLPLEYRGKKMVLPTSWKSTHPTSGLEDEGFTHAQDIMGKAGTPVGAPVAGTIMRVGSAQGGESIYLRGEDGRVYWIGHIETDLPAGTKVKRGQTLAMISPDHPRPHVHLDYSTSY